MKKTTIKAVCAILVLLMVVPMLFACKDNGGDQGTTQNSQAESSGTETAEEKLEVPDNLKFDGEEFNILTAGNVAYDDFNYTSEDMTTLGAAQYKRKVSVESKFGITITAEKKANGSSYGNGPGYTSIKTGVDSNDVIYHLGIIGGYDVANLAMNSYLYDLNSVDYIDTSKSWWDQNANKDLSINGMLFFTNGNLTGAYSESTYVIYMNKTLAAQKSVEDVYQIVKDGKWTIDKLAECSKLVSEDLDGNDTMGPADRFGTYVWYDSILGMIAASGSKSVTVQSDGTIELTLNNDNTLNMFNKYLDMTSDQEYALIYQKYSGQMSVLTSWQNDQALFWVTSNINSPLIRDMESDFGILPYPKLSEDQTRYYSTIAPYNSQFICVPLITDDATIEYIGAVTETLAYEGQKTVWPALYEQTLKGAFARDEETYDMLDIIYSNYGYDVGYYYQIGEYGRQMMICLRDNNKNFNSMYETYRSSAEAKIDKINADFAQVLDWWDK